MKILFLCSFENHVCGLYYKMYHKPSTTKIQTHKIWWPESIPLNFTKLIKAGITSTVPKSMQFYEKENFFMHSAEKNCPLHFV